MPPYLQVLVVVDAKPKDQKLPTDAYYAVEEVHDVRYLYMCTVYESSMCPCSWMGLNV